MKEDEGGIYSKGPNWKAFSFCLRYTGKKRAKRDFSKQVCFVPNTIGRSGGSTTQRKF